MIHDMGRNEEEQEDRGTDQDQDLGKVASQPGGRV
jgi:hypothetical protein